VTRPPPRTPPILADHAGQYDSGELRRPGGDPLGQRGLPRDRFGLDRVLEAMIGRLQRAGERGLPGRQLAEELGLTTRALRLLRAYAEVHLGVWQVVGMPGHGYRWSTDPEDHRRAAADAERRGRCDMHRAGVHRRAAGRQLPLFAVVQ